MILDGWARYFAAGDGASFPARLNEVRRTTFAALNMYPLIIFVLTDWDDQRRFCAVRRLTLACTACR
jgi:hypothetical protein